MQKGEQQVYERTRRIPLLGILLCSGLLVSGCVVLEEKYNAEKARSLNFQRLLAQEEKRTAELDSEIRHTKAELAEFEVRNRELSAQVQVAREQMGRLQEETEAIREATVLERKALEDMQRKGPSLSSKPKKVEASKAVSGGRSGGSLSDKGMAAVTEPASAMKVTPGMVHVVKPGETLFSIGRRYGVEVDKLKKLNKLPDDIVEIGQKLLVGAE
ncbi:MAG TPA: LysM peptidoglycan-binding domain-containing protein [Nitrospira sp.]|nr:LysM peptidoglycan-binding domain-containing protein [Nitrospira sp.]HWG96784.1 LysM peptidoglycan-binding domain-containing protein [Nitrospira sp.]